MSEMANDELMTYLQATYGLESPDAEKVIAVARELASALNLNLYIALDSLARLIRSDAIRMDRMDRS